MQKKKKKAYLSTDQKGCRPGNRASYGSNTKCVKRTKICLGTRGGDHCHRFLLHPGLHAVHFEGLWTWGVFIIQSWFVKNKAERMLSGFLSFIVLFLLFFIIIWSISGLVQLLKKKPWCVTYTLQHSEICLCVFCKTLFFSVVVCLTTYSNSEVSSWSWVSTCQWTTN